MSCATPEPGAGRRAWLLAGAFYAVAALLLTWPWAFSPGQAVALRSDYFQNLWNAWWVRTALFELHASPWWTDHLFHPVGISLGRHTLSPLNALPGAALGGFLGPHAVYKAQLLLHFWLGGWCFFAFARYLTGSAAGALLGGLVFSFSPFHYHYAPQINAATLEFLPLSALFLIRSRREGGWRNAVGAVLVIALLAASHWYYLVQMALFGALLLLCGRLESAVPEPRRAAGRLLAVGAAAGVAVAFVAWPLLRDALEPAGELAPLSARARAGAAGANDLFGMLWPAAGGSGLFLVSWPTLFGYSTGAILLLGWRGWWRQRFWLLVGALFFALSLGPSLRVWGQDTGIPLLFGWLRELPGLWMLAKPARFLATLQLVVALLCAFAWRDLLARLRVWLPARACGAATAVACLCAAVELGAAPLATFPAGAAGPAGCSPYLASLARDPSVEVVASLPSDAAGGIRDGRYLLCQIEHGKKIPQSYTTGLAVTTRQHELAEVWVRATRALARGELEPLRRALSRSRVDVLVLHKTELQRPGSFRVRVRSVWAPFALLRGPLVTSRLLGPQVEGPVPPERLARELRALRAAFGPAVHEDARIAAFRVGPPDAGY